MSTGTAGIDFGIVQDTLNTIASLHTRRRLEKRPGSLGEDEINSNKYCGLFMMPSQLPGYFALTFSKYDWKNASWSAVGACAPSGLFPNTMGIFVFSS